MHNVLSIDIEDWYQPLTPSYEWKRLGNRVEKNTCRLLEILAQHKTKATFFVSAHIAEKNPGLIQKIQKENHEIASHGYAHNKIYDLIPEQFKTDLKKSLGILQDVTGLKVIGFRAPWFSIRKKENWIFDILIDNEIQYDSSIFPVKNHIYGDPKAQRWIHIIHRQNGQSITEIPMSTIRIAGINLPFIGGFYSRLLPYPLTKQGIKLLNANGKPAIMYLHPWEIDPETPKIKTSFTNLVVHRINLNKTENKLQKLLADFSFIPIQELLDNYKKDNQHEA